MAVSRVKTWVSDETLTASDLNAEFNNILNNGEDLAWPATKAKAIDISGAGITPDGSFHIHTASAGAVTSNIAADELTLENSANCGLSILTPDADISAVYWGSASDNVGAAIQWAHSTLLMSVGTHITNGILGFVAGNGTEVGRFTPSTNLLIGTAVTEDGTATRTITVQTGAEPAAGAADGVQIYSIDDAAGHTIPAFYCEGTNVVATGQGDSASSVRVKMRINGTTHTFLCI